MVSRGMIPAHTEHAHGSACGSNSLSDSKGAPALPARRPGSADGAPARQLPGLGPESWSSARPSARGRRGPGRRIDAGNAAAAGSPGECAASGGIPDQQVSRGYILL